jgi:trimethylamine--corrinoid protein Co-methyltransferase
MHQARQSDSHSVGGRGVRSKLAANLKVLDESAVQRIHHASLRILEQVGVKIEHVRVREMLQEQGAWVEDQRVRFPCALVEDAVQKSPSKVTLYARDPAHNVYLGEGKIHFTNGFGATWVEDVETKKTRLAETKDLAALTRLADALPRVDYCLFPVVPQDVPKEKLDLECTAIALQNTTKHVQLSLETSDWVHEAIALGKAVAANGQPAPISSGGVPNSPLQFSFDTLEKFILLAQNDIPTFIVVGAMAGATAPVTLAGALTLQNAEFLAGLVVTQMVNPGTPVIYGTFSGGFDMRSTKLALGGPELYLITAATQQICNYYQVPLGYATGGVTDSAWLDIQTGIEKAQSTLFAALAGVDVIHDGASGLLQAGMLTSYSGMVIGNDICEAVAYLISGVEVNEENLAMEVISQVGPGGTYLDQLHTADHFREALALLPLRWRESQVPDSLLGGSGMVDKARERAKSILASHAIPSLSDSSLAEIARIRDIAYSAALKEQRTNIRNEE